MQSPSLIGNWPIDVRFRRGRRWKIIVCAVVVVRPIVRRIRCRCDSHHVLVAKTKEFLSYCKIKIAEKLPDAHKWNAIDFVPAIRPIENATMTVACVAKTTGNVRDSGSCGIVASDTDADRTDSRAKVAVEVSCED